jgi:RNA polymerase sigma factor (sigma-70 family)
MFGSPLRTEADQDRFLMKIYTTALEIAAKIEDVEDIDDLVQDIALSCLTRLRKRAWTHEPANFESFVRNLVNDSVIDRWRKRVSDAEHDAQHLADRTDHVPDWMPADQSQSEQALEPYRRSIVDKLPVSCRSPYHLVRECGLSYEQAAAILGITANTVHNHINHAQRILRNELRKAGIPVQYTRNGGRPRGGRWRCNQMRLKPRYLPPNTADRDADDASLSPDMLTQLARLHRL